MAVIPAFAQDALDRAEPLTVAAAYAQCRAAAVAESMIGAVGLVLRVRGRPTDAASAGRPGVARA
jgi:hypothetical protein